MVLGWYEGKQKVDLSDYVHSGTWDVVECPGRLENKRDPGESHNRSQISRWYHADWKWKQRRLRDDQILGRVRREPPDLFRRHLNADCFQHAFRPFVASNLVSADRCARLQFVFTYLLTEWWDVGVVVWDEVQTCI